MIELFPDVLWLVRELLETPGAVDVQVSWTENDALSGVANVCSRTFLVRHPPGAEGELAMSRSADHVRLILGGQLAGGVPPSNLLAYLRSKRLVAGRGEFPCAMTVVRAGTAEYVLESAEILGCSAGHTRRLAHRQKGHLREIS